MLYLLKVQHCTHNFRPFTGISLSVIVILCLLKVLKFGIKHNTIASYFRFQLAIAVFISRQITYWGRGVCADDNPNSPVISVSRCCKHSSVRSVISILQNVIVRSKPPMVSNLRSSSHDWYMHLYTIKTISYAKSIRHFVGIITLVVPLALCKLGRRI